VGKTEEVKERHNYIRARLQETRGDWDCAGYEVMMKFHLSHVTATKHVRMIAKEMGMDVQGVYKLPKDVDKLAVKAKKTTKKDGTDTKAYPDKYYKAGRKIDPKESKFKCKVQTPSDVMWVTVRAVDKADAKEKVLKQLEKVSRKKILEVMSHKEHNDKHRRSEVYTSRNFY